MGGQRHQGSPVIDRYMMPQAKRYKHSYGLPEKTQSTERPNAVRRGSSSESGITLTLGPGDVAAVDKLGSSQSSVSESKESDAIVIFLPIFGFECHRHRKYLSDAISNASGELKTSQQDKVISEAAASKSSPSRHAKRRSTVSSSYYSTPSSPFKDAAKLLRNAMPVSNQSLLLDGYLRSPKPVHCRRTLDQFSYYMLSSTETRDKSQVAYKWAKDTKACDKAKDRPIIMVDQLWVWILHNGTVITSFPTTWNGDESYDLMKALMAELGGNKERPLIRSAEHLLHLILRTSLDFCKRKGPAGFRFEDCFRGSINSVSEKQNLLFDEFRRITTRLEKGNLSPKKKKKEIESLLRLDEETKLLIEIMDIQDELTIIKTILSQQETVLQSLLLLYPKKGRDDESDGEDDADKPLRNREIEGLVRDLLRAFGQGPVVNDTSKVGSDVPPRHVHFQEVLCHQQATGTLPTDSSIQGGECSNGGELARSSSQGELKGKGKEGQSEQQAAGPSPQLIKGPEAKRRDQEEWGPTASSDRVNKPETKKQKALLTHPDLMYGTLGIVQGHIRVVTNMLEVAEKVQSLVSLGAKRP
ncbi:hypothetical protein QC762_302370 [Podospora pseudocomata]|uniref:Uncharacterized protein n=1 Tax=Podospora pseudocomata TaxID=2093779 RepID=A0ABR0GI46_9PEZI|nr:hypothetical protein QC762_302370 [Podospora pseudocomata]